MAQPTYPHNIKKNYVWWVEGNQLAIAYAKDAASGDTLLADGTYNSTNSFKAPSTMGEWISPHEVSSIRLVTVRKGEPTTGDQSGTLMTALTEVPEIPSQFHKALVYYAIARGHEKTADGLQVSQVFDAKYEMAVRKGVSYMGNERYYGIRTQVVNKNQGIV